MFRKLVFSFCFIACIMTLKAQDYQKFREIDSLISVVNNSAIEAKTDTIIHDQPSWGIKSRTFYTKIVLNSEIRKIVQRTINITTIDGNVQEVELVNSYNYYLGNVIKVEEAGFSSGKAFFTSCYFSNMELLYTSQQSKNGPRRARALLEMAMIALKK
ncbi:MAG: hypothetical protein EOO45_27605 [Flavobacterium sp.]|nr:MAG: hypothetical protein EOO45_27605 [Flavobacterium sp.]